MKKTKEANINIRITEDLRDQLNEVAQQKEIPAAQIVREAVREKVALLRKEAELETAEVTA
jgi:predicted DNA-binding protein